MERQAYMQLSCLAYPRCRILEKMGSDSPLFSIFKINWGGVREAWSSCPNVNGRDSRRRIKTSTPGRDDGPMRNNRREKTYRGTHRAHNPGGSRANAFQRHAFPAERVAAVPDPKVGCSGPWGGSPARGIQQKLNEPSKHGETRPKGHKPAHLLRGWAGNEPWYRTPPHNHGQACSWEGHP